MPISQVEPEPGPAETAASEGAALPSVTVVICAYTDLRWEQILAAVSSVDQQTRKADQCIVVVDHNDLLLQRARTELVDVEVVANEHERGLSGARNTGVERARGEIVAFLDDDARAEPEWLEELVEPYADPSVLGTGGVARPAWARARPAWFPPEFDWVVGCSYRGLPTEQAPIRNPIGSNMSFRRSAFETAGGFVSAVGRLGTLPLGCEETEFSIRLRQRRPDTRIVHVPGALVDHAVGVERTTLRYFFRRCVAEGVSKATVSAHVGNADALASERSYTTKVLPAGFVRGLLPEARRHEASPAASAMIVAGLLTTAFGYLLGRLGLLGVAGRLMGAR